jgi:hypothetical protein
MTTQTFHSASGNIPTLSENNNQMRKEKVRKVIMGGDAYEIMTREEPEPEGNNRDRGTELQLW